MKLVYRPEIDGLRAIAVVAVILYHAQITILGQQPFKGGLIGVDIFFVISGYLFTSIILKELINSGTFSFRNFYERRIRRILPALLLVMLASLPFAWIYLLPNDFIGFSKSILYSLGFSSNFYFWDTGQVYGAENGLLKPFLHTWSLSIEEQFYIFFPIILLLVFKYFKKYTIHILILGFVVSIGLANWGSRNYPSLNFYFLPTRVWELLAGSILAYFEITLGHRSRQKTLNLILPSLGLFLIGHSILFFNDKMYHPSFYTLSPIIGVCLIIWFSNKEEFIAKVLSGKLFVGIGLISYSLYLWHYPIFAYARTDFGHNDIVKKLLLIIIILILSIVSYYFIERPARSKKNSFRIILGLIIFSLSFLIVFNNNIISKGGYKNRLPEIINKNLSVTPWNLLKNLDGERCHNNKKRCKFNTFSNKKVYMIGDSHMATLTFDLKDKIIKKNYQFIASTAGQCLFYPDFDLVRIKTQKIYETCNNRYFTKLIKNFSNEKNSIIIIGGRFPLYLSNYFFNNQEGGIEDKEMDAKYISLGKYNTIQNSFKKEVLELSKNHQIILIYPIPEVGWNINKKLFNSIPKEVTSTKDYLVPQNYITTSYQVYKNRSKSSFDLLDSIHGDNIYRVYPQTLFCNTLIKDRCITHDDKEIFYADDDHPSIRGAEMINDLIMKEIKKIELRAN